MDIGYPIQLLKKALQAWVLLLQPCESLGIHSLHESARQGKAIVGLLSDLKNSRQIKKGLALDHQLLSGFELTYDLLWHVG